MSQPANDDFSQHLSDDEASYHEDASDHTEQISGDNYGVLCEDLLKGTHSGAKTKNLKNIVLTSNTPYPSRKIWRLCVCTSQETIKTYTPYPRALIRRIQDIAIKYSGRY
ncbi:hypothetical protein Tco_0550686 [Tanacetum coccineum]